MYGFDEPKKDTLDDDLNEVVSYLVHAQKKGHAETVLTAIRRLAMSNDRIRALSGELEMRNDRRHRNSDMMGYEERRQPEQVVKLPFGTRKVSIEL